ncbi:hypothetical protein CMV_014406 [Castanea mollissima]|uniref:Uncharacterized protein n=1 Tax=Castanea mollissima TaxID=60419 RepID=A0A8J4RBP2_9ROSI|nr:hypothetical protein CMV_014406 [Castanea mollissima]
MAFLFNKFQEAVKTLAKSPTFARDPRQLQFEADINRLFLYTRLKHPATTVWEGMLRRQMLRRSLKWLVKPLLLINRS